MQQDAKIEKRRRSTTFGSAYHKRPNGSTSDISSTPVLALLGKRAWRQALEERGLRDFPNDWSKFCIRTQRVFTLIFGAVAFESSALLSASEHRRHHNHVDQFAGFVCDSVRVVDSIAPRAFLANVEFHFCRKNYGRHRKQIPRKRSGKILRRRSMHRLRFVPRNGTRQFQTQRRRRSYLRLQTTRDP